jgi:hypothetical protein
MGRAFRDIPLVVFLQEIVNREKPTLLYDTQGKMNYDTLRHTWKSTLGTYISDHAPIDALQKSIASAQNSIQRSATVTDADFAKLDALHIAFFKAIVDGIDGEIPDTDAAATRLVNAIVLAAQIGDSKTGGAILGVTKDTKIPLFDRLGLVRGKDYTCVHAEGDGKCFFHAVCQSLNVDFGIFMEMLRESLMTEEADIIYDDNPRLTTGMLKLMHVQEEDGQPIQPSGWRLQDQFEYWTRRYMPDSSFQASLTPIDHTAKILFERGIALVIVQNEHGERRAGDAVQFMFARVIQRWVLAPMMQNIFGDGVRPSARRFPKISHVLFVNKSAGHYDATSFSCGDRSTYLLCLKELGNRPGPWRDLRDVLYRAMTEASDIREFVTGGPCVSSGSSVCDPPSDGWRSGLGEYRGRT